MHIVCSPQLHSLQPGADHVVPGRHSLHIAGAGAGAVAGAGAGLSFTSMVAFLFLAVRENGRGGVVGLLVNLYGSCGKSTKFTVYCTVHTV